MLSIGFSNLNVEDETSKMEVVVETSTRREVIETISPLAIPLEINLYPPNVHLLATEYPVSPWINWHDEVSHSFQLAIRMVMKKITKLNNRKKYLLYTQYDSSLNNWDRDCLSTFGWACGAIGVTTGLPGYILCGGGAVLSCWIPVYKICVASQWSSTCPIQ